MSLKPASRESGDFVWLDAGLSVIGKGLANTFDTKQKLMHIKCKIACFMQGGRGR